MIDVIKCQFLVSLTVSERLDMCLMDLMTAYLYASHDVNIYMKIHKEFKIFEAFKSKYHNLCSINLQQSLYRLKQSRLIWYHCLSEYLIKELYENDPIHPYVFIRRFEYGFAIVIVYVDDMNLIETPEELLKTSKYLKREFEMKVLGKMKFCLGLQIKHKTVHQSAYIEKNLKAFQYG